MNPDSKRRLRFLEREARERGLNKDETHELARLRWQSNMAGKMRRPVEDKMRRLDAAEEKCVA